MSGNIKTVMHTYQIDTSTEAGAKEHNALCADLESKGLRMLHMSGNGAHCVKELDGRVIELETAHLFSNQWNSAPIEGFGDSGLRVFDWYEYANFVYGGRLSKTKCGHWLEQTAEMFEIRRNTNGCGYCGRQEAAARGSVFCPHCIDSEYLKESDLHLTRMVAIADSDMRRAPLTEAERAHLLPLYREAQLHGTTERGIARIAATRASVTKKYESAIRNATAERDGFIWLLDNGIRTDNVIYYPHTGRFGFGWRSPVSDEIKAALLAVISEFGFPYDIKCADGRTLSGN